MQNSSPQAAIQIYQKVPVRYRFTAVLLKNHCHFPGREATKQYAKDFESIKRASISDRKAMKLHREKLREMSGEAVIPKRLMRLLRHGVRPRAHMRAKGLRYNHDSGEWVKR